MKTILFVCGIALVTLASHQLMAFEAKPQQTVAQQETSAVTKVDINKASTEQLALIPGIGSQKALAIQHYISEHGAIRSEAQLTEVRGIGGKLAATVAQYVHFDG